MIHLPHSRGNAFICHFIGFVNRIQAIICPDPYASSFCENFAHPIVASAARPVSGMLWTSGFRALESDVLNTAITAFATGKQHDLDRIFDYDSKQPAQIFPVYPFGAYPAQRGDWRIKIEKNIMHFFQEAKFQMFEHRKICLTR